MEVSVNVDISVSVCACLRARVHECVRVCVRALVSVECVKCRVSMQAGLSF